MKKVLHVIFFYNIKDFQQQLTTVSENVSKYIRNNILHSNNKYIKYISEIWVVLRNNFKCTCTNLFSRLPYHYSFIFKDLFSRFQNHLFRATSIKDQSNRVKCILKINKDIGYIVIISASSFGMDLSILTIYLLLLLFFE